MGEMMDCPAESFARHEGVDRARLSRRDSNSQPGVIRPRSVGFDTIG
jgi:hypothetical protein